MKWIGVVLCFTLVSCAMVNVYITFPEEQIREAAEEIEGEIEGEPAGDTSYLQFIYGKVLYAEEITPEIKTDSPVIRQAKGKRKSWRKKIDEFKRKGYIGESNRYSVEILRLPEDPEVAREVKEIVRKENRERDVIIKELVRINNARLQEGKFREIFAEVKRKYAKKGEWIQLPSGKWVQKE